MNSTSPRACASNKRSGNRWQPVAKEDDTIIDVRFHANHLRTVSAHRSARPKTISANRESAPSSTPGCISAACNLLCSRLHHAVTDLANPAAGQRQADGALRSGGRVCWSYLMSTGIKGTAA